MNKYLTYNPNTDSAALYALLISLAETINGNRKVRAISQKAVRSFINLIDENPNAGRIRRYSNDGFVANSYDYPASIVYAEASRNEDGSFSCRIATTGAKRSHGAGSLIVIQ